MATTVETLASYYQNLLIRQYYDKPNAMATINALATQMLCDWVFPQVKDAFRVTDAIGVQLDIIGKYVGLDRTSAGGVALGDSDYRFLIKMKIIQNTIDQTLYSIQKYIHEYFNTTIRITDNLDMTITYEVSIAMLDIMILAIAVKALPRPIGVAIVISATLNPNGDFGYSFNGTAYAEVNGYGVVGHATYEGGTYLRSIPYT